MHTGGFELTKLTYTRLEDNLIRHRGENIEPPGTPVTCAHDEYAGVFFVRSALNGDALFISSLV